MPTINVKKDLLMKQLGHNYTNEEFDELCFQFGIELDEVTSEKEMALKADKAVTDGKESDDIIYKIDIPANRYDLLCLEGLVVALKIFTNKLAPPDFKITDSMMEFFVDEHATQARPILLAAVVRNVTFNLDIYNSFIELQEKIHQNIGRKRSLVSIGTHDLDTIQGPFLYTALEPKKLRFRPLNQEKEYSGDELMELYADSHLKSYLPIIKNKPKYPCIIDVNKTVLSMPPIINGDTSKITLKTKNILIEVTARDREKATIALDNVVAMLMNAKGCYDAESVRIKHYDGREYIMPKMVYQKEKVEAEYINKSLGINLSPEEITKLMTRMSLKANVCCKDMNQIEVFIPPTRHDIINKCDIMEDVGIAYGYDNIRLTLPKCSTIATQIPLNKLSDQLRHELARCGFTEALNFALCSEAEISSMLCRPYSLSDTVRLQNPKTIEFQVARTCLLTGLLKTLNSNKKLPLPMKLFEISDILLVDNKIDVCVRNERHIGAVYCGKQSSGFETIHGLLDRIMQILGIKYVGESKVTHGYYIKAHQDGAYLKGRCAAIVHGGEIIGTMGTLHPEVLTNFELNHPTSAMEINMEKLKGLL